MEKQQQEITASEVTLRLVDNSPNYIEKEFVLEIRHGSRAINIRLDGIQIGDIVADAKNAGIPVDRLVVDGIVRPRDMRNEKNA